MRPRIVKYNNDINFNKSNFDRFEAVLELNDKQVNAVNKRATKWLPKAIELIDMSFLTEDLRKDYKELITQRVKQLTS